MTEQFHQNNFSGDRSSSINVDLVFMQIQAITTSLRRLTAKENDQEVDIPTTEETEATTKLDC